MKWDDLKIISHNNLLTKLTWGWFLANLWTVPHWNLYLKQFCTSLDEPYTSQHIFSGFAPKSIKAAGHFTSMSACCGSKLWPDRVMSPYESAYCICRSIWSHHVDIIHSDWIICCFYQQSSLRRAGVSMHSTPVSWETCLTKLSNTKKHFWIQQEKTWSMTVGSR